MTETKLPEELEERAMLYALGALDPEERQAFEVRLKGESGLLRQVVRAHRTVTGVLAQAVTPMAPPAELRERLVHHIALEARREAEQFEFVANTLALHTAPMKPRDAIRNQLFSRIGEQAKVRLERSHSLRVFEETAVPPGDESVNEKTRGLPQEAGTLFTRLRSCWTAVSNFLHTLLIRSVAPGPSAQGLTFVKASEGTWWEIAPGVMAKLLSFDPVSQRTTALLRFAAGTRYAPHRHPEVEELYVLEGGCSIAGREMEVGDYHRAEAGTVHYDTSTNDGCLLLVISSPRNEVLR